MGKSADGYRLCDFRPPLPAFSMVLGQNIPIPGRTGRGLPDGGAVALISVTGIRTWILRNIPMGIAHGTGIGIGLFLLPIAATNIDLCSLKPVQACRCYWGFHLFPVMIATGRVLAVIFGLERLKVRVQYCW